MAMLGVDRRRSIDYHTARFALAAICMPAVTGRTAAFPFQRILSMAVPKRKTTPSRRGMRRAHDFITPPAVIEDKDSGEFRRPHHIDLKTGMYRGRQVIIRKEKSESDEA